MGQAMILRRGVGAAGLKVDITGGTVQPTGVENRIWINTATAIGTVTVDSAAPSTHAAGDVYIELDAATVAVVALSNRTQIVKLPLGIAYQYDGGAWVSMNAYVYLSGTWVSFSTDIPDGDTVTPVDDTNTWLRCAGLNPSAEGNPTLAQVVASATLCATLMASANAVNYMIRSTTIQTAVLGSATAITALDNSSPFLSEYMTGANAPAGYSSDNYLVANSTGNYQASAAGGVYCTPAKVQMPGVWPYYAEVWASSGIAGDNPYVKIEASNNDVDYVTIYELQSANNTKGSATLAVTLAGAYQYFRASAKAAGAGTRYIWGMRIKGKTREVV